MRWRWVFLIGTPVAFGYALRQAANAANTVDLDLFTAFVYLLIALPLGLMLTASYSSVIGEWIGDAVWMRFSENPGYDHPHWLVYLTRWLERHECRFTLRWTCFFAVQILFFSEWAILYKRGLGAAREGTWLECYFARHLYQFSNALDSLKAAEVMVRHGIQPKAHPDAQVQLFILRAGLPKVAAKKKGGEGGAETDLQAAAVNKGAEPEETLVDELAVARPVLPEDLNPLPPSQPVGGPLLRNRAIALFEGAEESGPAWNSYGADPAEPVGLPFEDGRATTVLFAAPSPPVVQFKPIRLDSKRYQR